MQKKAKNIYIDGTYGIGKTHLLSACFHNFKGSKAFISFLELTYFMNFSGLEKTIEFFKPVDLLLIDEFDLDDPGDNPDRYLKIRQSLIEKCAKYTGYDNNKSFMTINPAELVDNENFIATFTDSFSKRLSSMINGWKVDELTYKNGELKKEVDKLRQLNNVLSNNLQKVQDDYTGLIYDYNTIKNTSVKYIVRTMSRKVGAKIRRHK